MDRMDPCPFFPPTMYEGLRTEIVGRVVSFDAYLDRMDVLTDMFPHRILKGSCIVRVRRYLSDEHCPAQWLRSSVMATT